ncbi:unnamed protein product [Lepidochelys kempii]
MFKPSPEGRKMERGGPEELLGLTTSGKDSSSCVCSEPLQIKLLWMGNFSGKLRLRQGLKLIWLAQFCTLMSFLLVSFILNSVVKQIKKVSKKEQASKRMH